MRIFIEKRARLSLAMLLLLPVMTACLRAASGNLAAPTGPTSSNSSTGSGGGASATSSGTRTNVRGSSGTTGGTAGAIRWVGRVDASNPNAVKFAWSATGLVATVNGTKISVKLQTEGATTSAFFQPVIDGNVGTRFQVMTGSAQTVVLADGLAAGEHKVELYRDSEGMNGVTVFSGFADGTVVGAPPASGRLIEVVGDSISAGYGNLGVEVHPPWDNTCGFTLDTEAAYQAYDAILGRSLNAEISVIARSGWGMYRDYGGSTANVLSSIYANTLGSTSTPSWDFSRKPDAVLINLGTNDSHPNDPGRPYEDAYVAFLRTVRDHYPSAWIFLTIGPMTSDPLLTTMRTHLTHVVATFADAKVVTIDLPTQDAKSTGCDYHPNVAEDKIMADTLAAAMKPKLGW